MSVVVDELLEWLHRLVRQLQRDQLFRFGNLREERGATTPIDSELDDVRVPVVAQDSTVISTTPGGF